MNKLTTLLLTIFALSCNAQEPDTLTYYSVEHVDSLINRIEFLESALNVNEVSVIADTFNLEIVDDRIKVEVNKIGYNVWVNVIDGYKRINSDYYNGVRSIMLMDSTHTVGSLYIR